MTQEKNGALAVKVNIPPQFLCGNETTTPIALTDQHNPTEPDGNVTSPPPPVAVEEDTIPPPAKVRKLTGTSGVISECCVNLIRTNSPHVFSPRCPYDMRMEMQTLLQSKLRVLESQGQLVCGDHETVLMDNVGDITLKGPVALLPRVFVLLLNATHVADSGVDYVVNCINNVCPGETLCIAAMNTHMQYDYHRTVLRLVHYNKDTTRSEIENVRTQIVSFRKAVWWNMKARGLDITKWLDSNQPSELLSQTTRVGDTNMDRLPKMTQTEALALIRTKTKEDRVVIANRDMFHLSDDKTCITIPQMKANEEMFVLFVENLANDVDVVIKTLLMMPASETLYIVDNTDVCLRPVVVRYKDATTLADVIDMNGRSVVQSCMAPATINHDICFPTLMRFKSGVHNNDMGHLQALAQQLSPLSKWAHLLHIASKRLRMEGNTVIITNDNTPMDMTTLLTSSTTFC